MLKTFVPPDLGVRSTNQGLSKQGTQVPPSSQVEKLTDSDFQLNGLSVRTSNRDDVVAKLGKWDSETELKAIGTFLSYRQSGLYVMTSFGTLKVLDFYIEPTSTFRTARGITVGATQADVVKAYGQPDRIGQEGGQVLIYDGPKDSGLQIGLQLVDSRVKQIGLGDAPLVWTMPQ